jgi:hypothetical protein
MTPKVLFDYAVNTGKFYEQHVTMAREGATHRLWALHTRVNILPLYRKEHREPYEGMSIIELDAVADQLIDHYTTHISEF